MDNLVNRSVNNGFRRLGVNSIIYTLGDIISKGIVFFLIPIYARLLSPAEYGKWGVLLSIASLLSILLSLQLGSSLTVNYFQIDENARQEFVSTLLVATLFSSTLFIVLFAILWNGRIGFFFLYLSRSDYFLLIGICFFSAINTIPQTLMRLRQNAIISVSISSTSYLIGAAVGIYFLAHYHLGVTGLLAGNLIANLISVLLHLFVIRDNLILKFSMSIACQSMLVSLPIIPHLLGHWGLNLMDRLVLQMYLPMPAVGVYQLGYQLGTSFQIIVIALNSAWTPYFMQNFIEEKHHLRIKLSSTWLTMFLTWGGLALILLLPILARWFLPNEYSEALGVIPWIITGFLFVGIYQFWANIILFYKKTLTISIITAVSALSNLALNLVLIPRYGYIVAAINTMISYFVLACFSGLIARRISSFTFEYYRWIKILLTGGLLYLLVSLIGAIYGTSYSFWVNIAALMAYPAVLWLFGFLNPGEEKFIKGKVGGIFR